MTRFTVHRVSCDRCGGAGELLDSGGPHARSRRCSCAEGVSGWEIRETTIPDDLSPGLSHAVRAWLDGRGPAPAGVTQFKTHLIGTLPAGGTIDRDSAETFASCLECVPGREVEALEEFAETEVYPTWMIEALGAQFLAESELPERERAGVRP